MEFGGEALEVDGEESGWQGRVVGGGDAGGGCGVEGVFGLSGVLFRAVRARRV